MSIIKISDYIFSVDIEKTKSYHRMHSLCNCIECHNYYVQVKDRFPKLNDFLNKFGVDITRPDEIVSIEMNTYIDYCIVDYTVCGSINLRGKNEICIYDDLSLSIIISDGFVSPNE